MPTAHPSKHAFFGPILVLAFFSIASCNGGGSVNSAPTVSGVTITQTENKLVASYTYEDEQNDAEGATTYQWYRNGQAINGATSTIYTVIPADSDQRLTFEVTPIALTGTLKGLPVTSGNTWVKSTPIASTLSITDDNGGQIQMGDILIGNYLYSDAESDPEGTSTFRWLRDGTAITGATSLTYTLTQNDMLRSISFEVTPVAATGESLGSPAVFSLYTGVKVINDTGITLCGDYAYTDSGTYAVSGSGTHNNNLDCAIQPGVATQTTDGSESNGDIIRGGQDALYGRDVSNNDFSDGFAGFSFTKLDADGNPLTDQSQTYENTPWSCVKDNVTSLIWEVKTTSGLQNNSNTYTWYNSTGINDAGSAGTANGGNCFNADRCDTEKYVADVNAQNANTGLCGATDWRLPNKHELVNIVNNSQTSLAIDTGYFPNALARFYWSSSPYAGNSDDTWYISFGSGYVGYLKKSFDRYIRLVRGSESSEQ